MPKGSPRPTAGRKPKPTALKILHGSARAKRQAKTEPMPEAGAPPKPDWLGPVASDAWDRLSATLVDMRVLTVVDQTALEMLACVYEEWREAHETVKDEGTRQTINTQHGTRLQAHPSVAQRADAFRRLNSMVQEFGLTPSAKTRIRTPGEPEAHDPLQELIERRRGRP